MPDIRARKNPAPGGGPDRGAEYTRVKCPYCEKPYGNLPNHMRTCDERDDDE